MLVVHHLGISQSERIVWLCEELAIPYQLIRYERDPTTRLAPASYKALHPYGTAPVITDGELVLGESGAIMEYIIAKYGNGRLAVAPDRPNYAEYLYWFHFANGSMMANAMIDIAMRIVAATPQQREALRGLASRGERAWALLERRLGTVEYLAGSELTAADIIMLFPLTTMRAFVPRDLSACPNIRAYLQRVGARPAYQRAMSQADPGLPRLLE